MARIKYINHRFNKHSKPVIKHAIRICEDFYNRGFDLTLRQIYYQFVGHNLFPDAWIKDGTKNHKWNYDKLGKILSDARRAGLLDWDFMVDRGRGVKSRSHWDSEAAMLRAYAHNFTVNAWVGQPATPEVWVEKDALIGVFGGIARRYDVPAFSTRGYPSDSALHNAAKRIQRRADNGRKTVILHFADHDPSGLDMSRVIGETLKLFGVEKHFRIRRVALNMNQTKGLPPNFAKESDSRTQKYVETFKTTDCWELDAIDPDKLVSWSEREFKKLIKDKKAWEAQWKREKDGQALIKTLADRDPATLLDDLTNKEQKIEDLQEEVGEHEITIHRLTKKVDELTKKNKKKK